jgi:hypothetical protein
MANIVDREIHFQSDSGEEVAFKIGVGPLRREPDCWACDYSIEGPHPFAASAFGEDAMQALVMALHALQAHLNAPPLRGQVSWLGMPAADILALPGL